METDPKIEEETLLKKRSIEEMTKDDHLNVSFDENGEEKKEDDGESDEETAGDSKLVGEIDPLRLCIQGLDPFVKDKDLLKFCKNEFNPPIELTAITKKQGKSHAFLTFANVETKERFEKEGATKKFKNKKFKIRPVKSDHQALKYEKKIKTIEISKPKQPAKQEDIEEEMAVPIQEKVCPYWKTPYEEQVRIKREAMLNVLKKISVNAIKTIKHENKTPNGLPNWLPDWLKERPDGPCCDLSDFIGADDDKTFYYRNKAEFTIGESYKEKGKIKVGFNVGNFNKGFMFVESAADCPIVSKESLELARILEKFVQESGIPAYNRIEHTGFWRAFVVRQSEKTKEVLLQVVGAKQAIDEEKYKKVKEDLVNLFNTEFKETDYKIVSILMLDHNAVSDNIPFDAPTEILYGDRDYYMDEVMGFKFRVNANAFLQVNSSQCEKLYSLVKKVAEVDENTVFLDICCGIGTIGICAASNSKKIIGVEMVERAIKDAEHNAEINGLKNTEFHAAKVESVITNVIKPYMGSNKFIGVVDPPRGGLHKDVIRALRTCKGLDKLVYVSCNPEGSMIDNVLGLCLPETKRRKAPPFTVTEAYGVDLFPQTNHFEGVLLLERLYDKKKAPKKTE